MEEQRLRCRTCREEKPVSCFWVDRSVTRGYNYCCILCLRSHRREKRLAAEEKTDGTRVCKACHEEKPITEFYLSHSGTRELRCKRCVDRRLWYGLSHHQYEEMVKTQQGCCAVCHRFTEKLIVDHDHVSMEIRGLLCASCNTAIGLFGEKPDVFQDAMHYLLSARTGLLARKKHHYVSSWKRYPQTE